MRHDQKPMSLTEAIEKGQFHAEGSFLPTYPGHFPADPLKDEPTRAMTHRGGVASPRTEHY